MGWIITLDQSCMFPYPLQSLSSKLVAPPPCPLLYGRTIFLLSFTWSLLLLALLNVAAPPSRFSLCTLHSMSLETFLGCDCGITEVEYKLTYLHTKASKIMYMRGYEFQLLHNLEGKQIVARLGEFQGLC